jgi:hypothetical protein
MLTALSYQGGPTIQDADRNLLRAAVAALLNSTALNGKYSLTTAQILTQVNAAMATGDRDTILGLQGQIDRFNNLGGCPLN